MVMSSSCGRAAPCRGGISCVRPLAQMLSVRLPQDRCAPGMADAQTWSVVPAGSEPSASGNRLTGSTRKLIGFPVFVVVEWTAKVCDDSLFDEFCETLEKNKLLLPDERSSFSAVKPGISLFAITAMHQCKIDLGDGTYATLQAACNDGVIKVQVTGEVKNIFVRRNLFATTLPCADRCTPELLELESWDFPLELTAECKLGLLK